MSRYIDTDEPEGHRTLSKATGFPIGIAPTTNEANVPARTKNVSSARRRPTVDALELRRLGEDQIRAALIRSLTTGAHTDELLVQELGLLQGSSRVDVAVVNGCVHGYEIKSDADTLERLAGQIDAYSRVLHFVTLVVTKKHASAARPRVPRWWGIAIAEHGTDGVSITQRRRARRNPRLDGLALAQLLWRDEVIEILRGLGAERGLMRGPRMAMWQALVETLPPDELTVRVCMQLRSRGDWRGAVRLP